LSYPASPGKKDVDGYMLVSGLPVTVLKLRREAGRIFFAIGVHDYAPGFKSLHRHHAPPLKSRHNPRKLFQNGEKNPCAITAQFSLSWGFIALRAARGVILTKTPDCTSPLGGYDGPNHPHIIPALGREASR